MYENNDVDKTLLHLLCISNIAKRWGGKNIYDLIDKEIKGKHKAKNMSELKKQQIRKYKIDRARLFEGSKHSRYVHQDIVITIIMQSRLSDPKTITFRADLELNQIKASENEAQSTKL